MARKQKAPRPHHQASKHEKRTKRFLKVYAPYIPLLLIVGAGLFLSSVGEFKKIGSSQVLSYAINTTDDGLLEATNKARQDSSLPALSKNDQLDKAAQDKANDMAAKNYWSHNTPDGKEPWYFIEDTGYGYYKAAENLAYGFNTSKSTVSGWMNSPTHRANVLDPVLQEVGFGIVNVPSYQNQGPQTIVVAMYGKPVTLPASTTAPTTPTQKTAASITPSESKNISYVQTLTNGQAPWSSFALGIMIGIVLAYLALKHGHGLSRRIRKGEKFILHHPLLDTTLIALVALAAIVSQTAGTIH